VSPEYRLNNFSFQQNTSYPDHRRQRKSAAQDERAIGGKVTIVGTVLVAFVLLGFLVVWLMGESNPYGAVRIVGTLTLDGEPIAGASVVLHPRDRKNGIVAGGITDRQGKFTVTTGTAPMANGAVPGEYDVTFQKIEVESTARSVEIMQPAPATLPPRSVQASSRKYVIPQKYGNPRTSGQFIVVEPNGANIFSFEITTAEQP
jgi:hypothetical protein